MYKVQTFSWQKSINPSNSITLSQLTYYLHCGHCAIIVSVLVVDVHDHVIIVSVVSLVFLLLHQPCSVLLCEGPPGQLSWITTSNSAVSNDQPASQLVRIIAAHCRPLVMVDVVGGLTLESLGSQHVLHGVGM